MFNVLFISVQLITEPRHDKSNKMAVRTARTSVSLGIRPVWSESLLSAWRKLGSLAIHWVHSEDSDQIWRMPRLIRVFDGSTLILFCFDMSWLILSRRNGVCEWPVQWSVISVREVGKPFTAFSELFHSVSTLSKLYVWEKQRISKTNPLAIRKQYAVMVCSPSRGSNNLNVYEPHRNLGRGLCTRKIGLCLPVIYYWRFQGGASVLVYFNCQCSCSFYLG